MASLVAQLVKNLPAMQDIQVQSLGQKDPLGAVTTHSSILAWRIPIDRGAWQVIQSVGSQSQTRQSNLSPVLSTVGSKDDSHS